MLRRGKQKVFCLKSMNIRVAQSSPCRRTAIRNVNSEKRQIRFSRLSFRRSANDCEHLALWRKTLAGRYEIYSGQDVTKCFMRCRRKYSLQNVNIFLDFADG